MAMTRRSRQWERMTVLQEQVIDLPHREEFGKWQIPLPRLGRRLQGEYIALPPNGKVAPRPPRPSKEFRFLSISAGSRRYQGQIVLVLWWQGEVRQ